MALITRVSRLFWADLHAVLDRIEEPDILLKQAIREMEDDILQDEQHAKLLNHEGGQLVQRQSELDESLEQIEEELDICFASNKDDLARALIKRKLEAQRLIQLITRKREAMENTIDDLNNRLSENRTRLAAMKQKWEILAERAENPQATESFFVPNVSINEEDVEVTFLREKQNRRTQ